MFKVKVEMSENPSWILKQFQKQANKFLGKVEIGAFGMHSGKRSITMPDLAAIHEYGAPSRKIPERSFLRASITQNQGKYGKYLRHPFSGVSLAEQCGVPADVCHIIATHAGEGDMVKRTTEAFIVHHADFMTFEPFKDRLK